MTTTATAIATAAASAATGVPMVASTLMQDPMEDVAAALGDTPGLFQLYPPNDRELTESFVHRAEAAGFSAIVVTLDTLTLGWRPRDLHHRQLPPAARPCLANYFSDPVFRSRLAAPPEEDPRGRDRAVGDGLRQPVAELGRPGWLRSLTDMPLLLKGICHPDDARRAVDAGVDGIYCSNHGGRQANGGCPRSSACPASSRQPASAGDLRLRRPQRRRRRQGAGARRDRGRHRPPLRLRARGRRQAGIEHVSAACSPRPT